ncbi:MAG: PQQ-binding-like beta-propeller repeat protein [Pirellulaceae bacterium]|nr:PQQ-binding-like beta-propeller repeat protein [Pirellulaceae bacterium]
MYSLNWRKAIKAYLAVVVVLHQACSILAADTDWPVFGRDATRNAVVPEGIAPTAWDVTTGRNIKWKVKLGYETYAAPVISDGQVYIGTNNGAAYLERYPATIDLGCLLCFRESDGQFIWQYSAEKLPIGRVHDWPDQGLVSSPLVEGERMWFVSNRHVLICLDTQGFRDGENDGPWVDEPVKDSREADVVWQFDLIKELGVFPHPPGMGANTRCSIAASYGNRIYVVTGNGTDEIKARIPAPDAPSLVCFDKNTGKVLWTDASPGANVLDCQASHPLVAEIDGRVQVIVAQGDGWVRSFDALTGEVIWKFDINRKDSVWRLFKSTRTHFLGTPVLYKGRVYIASGCQAEQGEGPGRLVCIDPTKTGDISTELAVDKNGKSIPHRRIQAVDSKKGEKAIANPNAGLIWEFTKIEGSDAFEDLMHRTLSTVAIHDGLVIAPDYSGIVHRLDADTGKRYWSYDAFADIWGSPLIIDKTVYVADTDGDVAIFRLSSDRKVAMNVGVEDRPIAEIQFLDQSISSSPVFANNVLYVAARSELYAITTAKSPEVKPLSKSKISGGVLENSENDVVASRVVKSIYAPTPQDIVEKMLEVAQVTKNDTVVDLGSGDGRIVITAAKKHGVRAIGYEIDSELVASSQARAEQAGVSGLVDIRRQDMYTADLSQARVATVFLYPDALNKLKPTFAKMEPGAKIVSHHYAIPNAKADSVVIVTSTVTGNDHRVLLYTLPLSYAVETVP